MELLLSLVARVHSGDHNLISLHDEAAVALNHPVKLFAARSLPRSQAATEFILLCADDAGLEVLGKIRPLIEVRHGHQYFDLGGDTVPLMISVNEYQDEWWENHG